VPHHLEDPDYILYVDEATEVKVQKYYTKEEREQMAEE